MSMPKVHHLECVTPEAALILERLRPRGSDAEDFPPEDSGRFGSEPARTARSRHQFRVTSAGRLMHVAR